MLKSGYKLHMDAHTEDSIIDELLVELKREDYIRKGMQAI